MQPNSSHLFRLITFTLMGRSMHGPCACGSQTEFYIQPVNSCIDDLDVLIAVNPYLALDSSCEIVKISGDIYDMIICYKPESYEHNWSFVRLRDPIIGTYDWSSEEYRFEHLDPIGLLPRGFSSGPASFLEFMEQSTMRYNRSGELTDMKKYFAHPWPQVDRP